MSIELNQRNKQLVWKFWRSLETAGAGEVVSVARQYMHEDALWHGPDPTPKKNS